MKIATLDKRNPCLDDASLDRLQNYDALYKGGAALEDRLPHLLPKRPKEEPEVYKFRLQSHHYVPYAGSLVDYLCSWLFTGRMEMRARDREDVPDWLATFKEDADGVGTDLLAMIRDRVRSALVKQRSWMLIDFPPAPKGADGAPLPPMSKAEWADAGLGKPKLRALDAEDVLDWELDDAGVLLWAISKQVARKRTSPRDARNIVTETWTIWERASWERYEISYEEGKRPDPEKTDLQPVEQGPSPTPDRVPLVMLDVPHGLWMMDRLYSPQLENFRSRNALSWSLNRTCYAMRIMHLERPMDEMPTHGPAQAMIIGKDEQVSWDAPPMDAFAPIAEYIADLKDEIYRIASHMALGVDNNAAAVGRSGESKGVDAGMTEVVLRAYGMLVCELVEEILQAITLARGEDDSWHVSGLDTFKAGDLGALVDAAGKLDALAIPSRTLAIAIAKRVARVAAPDASQDELDQIAAEIEKNITDEFMAERAVMFAASRGVVPDPSIEPEGGEEPGGDNPDEEAMEPPAAKAKAKKEPKAKAKPKAKG